VLNHEIFHRVRGKRAAPQRKTKNSRSGRQETGRGPPKRDYSTRYTFKRLIQVVERQYQAGNINPISNLNENKS
jgi:hypothetical protein